jgi:hypothetical protein
MKKTTIIASLTITAVFATLAIAFSVQPTYSDQIISPYLQEPIIPFASEPTETSINGTNLFSDYTVQDYAILPDNSIITVGQVYTDRNIFAPGLKRTDLGGGGIWTTFLNPVNIDGINYSELGTSSNTIQHLIYVNPNLIYAIGTIRAQLFDTDGNTHPISGFFGGQAVPKGDDLLVFVISFADNFSNVRFHGFLTPGNEEGLQQTIVSDVTLVDSNTMVLTGITNSHEGLFATGPTKPIFDFVLSVDVGEGFNFNHLFSFDHESYVQPGRVYALLNGDVIVSGQFTTSSGDFAHITLNQSVESAGFIARLHAETFTLAWVQSNLTKPLGSPATTQYLNVLELDTNELITIANVQDAQTQRQSVLVTILTASGKLRLQKSITFQDQDTSALHLFKAQTGYWIAGTTTVSNNTNLILIKLSPSLVNESIFEIKGSGEERWLGKPIVTTDNTLLLGIGTYSKDQDFNFLNIQTQEYFSVWMILS